MMEVAVISIRGIQIPRSATHHDDSGFYDTVGDHLRCVCAGDGGGGATPQFTMIIALRTTHNC